MAEMRYIPRNPKKYMGNPLKITARSKWELMYMNALDNSNIVAKWTSEPKTLNIKYISPIDQKPHQYWPDFLVQYIDGKVEILEIKPMKESSLATARSTYDKLMFAKNIAKWQAAERFAKAIGAKFRVITEQHLFGNKTPAPKRAKKPGIKK